MGKYLDFYKKCMETGRLPRRLSLYGLPTVSNGLCHDPTVGEGVLVWFSPDANLLKEKDRNEGWWGTEILYADPTGVKYKFCPLRQNIVLILAAIHNEL